MGPTPCMEGEIDELYGNLKEVNLNPLDLFKKKTLHVLSRVVDRAERLWEEEDEENYRIFRRMLKRAIDRKEDHDRHCQGGDECLDKMTDLHHKDVTRSGYSPLDLFQPETLFILEKATRRYREVWTSEDRKSFKVFRDMIWDALERWAEHHSTCDDDQELMDQLGKLRERIQHGS